MGLAQTVNSGRAVSKSENMIVTSDVSLNVGRARPMEGGNPLKTALFIAVKVEPTAAERYKCFFMEEC